MNKNRQKSELASAIEELASKGINTNGADFRLKSRNEFDPINNCWITKKYLVKGGDASETLYPMKRATIQTAK